MTTLVGVCEATGLLLRKEFQLSGEITYQRLAILSAASLRALDHCGDAALRDKRPERGLEIGISINV